MCVCVCGVCVRSLAWIPCCVFDWNRIRDLLTLESETILLTVVSLEDPSSCVHPLNTFKVYRVCINTRLCSLIYTPLVTALIKLKLGCVDVCFEAASTFFVSAYFVYLKEEYDLNRHERGYIR